VIVNNSCPSCGAVYNVTAKDVGRRIKCKKCNSPLVVTDAGLELEETAGSTADTGADLDEADAAPKRTRDRGRRSVGGGVNFGDALAKIGGIPGVLFGVGVFLVIFHIFMPIIADAKVNRKEGAIKELDARLVMNEKAVDENKDYNEEKKADRKKKLREEYDKDVKALKEEKQDAETSKLRSPYFDLYFLLFGFILIAFGCLGFLRGDQPLILRIVAAIILVSMVMAMFKRATGVSGGIGASIGTG
jgi:predicted Zn finger-like uncharacterized protein